MKEGTLRIVLIGLFVMLAIVLSQSVTFKVDCETDLDYGLQSNGSCWMDDYVGTINKEDCPLPSHLKCNIEGKFPARFANSFEEGRVERVTYYTW